MAMTAFCIALTLAAYIAVRRLYMRYRHPLINVVALAAGAVIAVLVGLDIPYRDFAPAKDIMASPLGAATVGLAVPLYRHRALLRRYGLAIIGSVALGALAAMCSAGLIARLGGLPREVVVSMLPKGATIPIAVEVAAIHGGVPPLTVAFVVATGTLGSLIGCWLLNLARVTDPVARGLALGVTSHGQGTATALMEGERQGAMAGLAMILTGLLTAAFAPLAVWLVGLF
jgi:predicted murein hydrolase (TIGR00659 family)